MRKVLTTAASAAILLSVAAGPVLADEHESDAVPVRPVEGWTCTYNDGKGRADLDKVNAEWNKWMDANDQNDYVAFLMTPQFFGEWAFDVAWIGVARDGNVFGSGTDLWLSEGGEVAAMFAEVITCSSHSAFISMNVKRMPPSDEEGDGQFVLNFSNCSLKQEGDEAFDDFMAAQKEWNAYADEHGFDYNAWVWWPMYGEADDSYDFARGCQLTLHQGGVSGDYCPTQSLEVLFVTCRQRHRLSPLVVSGGGHASHEQTGRASASQLSDVGNTDRSRRSKSATATSTVQPSK